jgi:hypothetical protein
MAVLFPLKLDGKRFYVNPTSIVVQKRSQINELRTMAGTTFQVWPDLPDEVSFEGLSFGIRSLQELKNLSGPMDGKSTDTKLVELIYKHQKYMGFMRDLKFSAEAENPRIFKYSFNFVVQDRRFNARDMALGQLVGLKAEYDFIEAQLRGASTTIQNIPADALSNVLAAANSISRIGVNIGRGQLPSVSSFRP